MKKEFIKTTFQQKKNEEVKEQWWLAYLNNRNFYSTCGYLDFVGTLKIKVISDYIKTINDSRLENIFFIPITEPVDQAKESRLFHRGYENDKNPIIYRGDAIPEIIYSYSMFHFSNRTIAMPQGLRNKLKLWFEDQLNAQRNQDLLSYLITQEKINYIHRTSKQMEELKEETDKFLLELKRQLNEIQNNKKRN